MNQIGSNSSFGDPERAILELVHHCLSISINLEPPTAMKYEGQFELDRHVSAFTSFLDELSPKTRSFYILKFTDRLLNTLKTELLSDGTYRIKILVFYLFTFKLYLNIVNILIILLNLVFIAMSTGVIISTLIALNRSLRPLDPLYIIRSALWEPVHSYIW